MEMMQLLANTSSTQYMKIKMNSIWLKIICNKISAKKKWQ